MLPERELVMRGSPTVKDLLSSPNYMGIESAPKIGQQNSQIGRQNSQIGLQKQMVPSGETISTVSRGSTTNSILVSPPFRAPAFPGDRLLFSTQLRSLNRPFCIASTDRRQGCQCGIGSNPSPLMQIGLQKQMGLQKQEEPSGETISTVSRGFTTNSILVSPPICVSNFSRRPAFIPYSTAQLA